MRLSISVRARSPLRSLTGTRRAQPTVLEEFGFGDNTVAGGRKCLVGRPLIPSAQADPRPLPLHSQSSTLRSGRRRCTRRSRTAMSRVSCHGACIALPSLLSLQSADAIRTVTISGNGASAASPSEASSTTRTRLTTWAARPTSASAFPFARASCLPALTHARTARPQLAHDLPGQLDVRHAPGRCEEDEREERLGRAARSGHIS